jgi:oxygen-independent coproporphyrinogen-3 oxidase
VSRLKPRGDGNFLVNFGTYIHIPFCQAKCNYCHFISIPYSQAEADRYHKNILKEIASYADSSSEISLNSIYFGGGTPSLIPSGQVEQILAACRCRFSVSESCEISLEANPGTLTGAKIASFRRSGVNRISLGGQSFDCRELSTIGRLHTPEMIRQAISHLRENGFTNLNLDLMLGLPGQTKESWQKNLEAIERLFVPHVSVYMLDLDDQCPLQAMVQSGTVLLPDDDLVSDLYLETIEFLSRRGYDQYEISNFALPGFQCVHNLKYWQREPFLGFGLGSHSFDGQSRYANFVPMNDYCNAVEAGNSAIEWRETLSRSQTVSESLFLGLRLTRGVDWKELQTTYGRDSLVQYESGMQDLTQKGLVEWADPMVRLTPAGMLLSNEVFQLFI